MESYPDGENDGPSPEERERLEALEAVTAALGSSIQSLVDKASRLGLHGTGNVMVGVRPSETGPPVPVAFVDFAIGSLAYSPGVQQRTDVNSERSLRSMEQGLEEDEFEAVRRRWEERRAEG